MKETTARDQNVTRTAVVLGITAAATLSTVDGAALLLGALSLLKVNLFGAST